jgi:hypothetical protein
MARRSKYTISYAPETYKHLDWIEVKYHRLIATTIQEQLSHRPATETRNREALEEPASLGATWELRFGPKNSFRVLLRRKSRGKDRLGFGDRRERTQSAVYWRTGV